MIALLIYIALSFAWGGYATARQLQSEYNINKALLTGLVNVVGMPVCVAIAIVRKTLVNQSIDSFFEALRVHRHGYEFDNGKVVMLKYYAQPSSFSWELRYFDEVQDIYDLTKTADYQSEVYYSWLNEDVRSEILKDIRNKLEELDKENHE